MTGQTAGPVFGFAFFYLLAVGVIAPVAAVVYLEVRGARRRARRMATRRGMGGLDGKRLERRVLAARSASGVR